MARKKNERLYTKEEEEIKAKIHRLNEKIRYAYKTYGVKSTTYKEMIKSAKELVNGIGGKEYNMVLEQRKSGLQTIPETYGAITRMATAMKKRRTYKQTWENVYNNFNAQALLKNVIKRSGYNDTGKIFKSVKETEAFIKENITRYEFLNKLISECLQRGILGSDEVNAFVHYRGNNALDRSHYTKNDPTHRRYFDKYISEHPNIDLFNEEDLEDFADFVRKVINGDYSLGDKVDTDRAGKLTLAQYTDKVNSTSVGIKSKKALQYDKSVDEYLKLAGILNKNK